MVSISFEQAKSWSPSADRNLVPNPNMTGQSKDHPQVRRRQADDQTLRPEVEGERGESQEEGRGRKEEGGEEKGVSR
jgi:hypothetical protein